MKIITALLRPRYACAVAAALGGLLAASAAIAGSLVPSEDVPRLIVGQWQGQWTTQLTPLEGTVTVDIRSVESGRIQGAGVSNGGPCSENFDVTGRHKGSQVELRLAFESKDCGQVGLSLRMGRGNDGKLMLLGYWNEILEGKAKGRDFGQLVLTK